MFNINKHQQQYFRQNKTEKKSFKRLTTDGESQKGQMIDRRREAKK